MDEEYEEDTKRPVGRPKIEQPKPIATTYDVSGDIRELRATDDAIIKEIQSIYGQLNEWAMEFNRQKQQTIPAQILQPIPQQITQQPIPPMTEPPRQFINPIEKKRWFR